MSRWVGAALAALGLTSAALGDQPVGFSNDVLPVLQARCVACHLTGDEAGGMSLAPKAAYANLVGVPSKESPNLRVKPGVPDESYLLMKLQGTQRDHHGIGARMPLGGPPLDDPTLTLIRAWIVQGAVNN
jgi:hypothetical protein